MVSERQIAGRFIGGQTTLLRHGREHFSEIGKLGGRPRLATIEERRQRLALDVQSNDNGGKLPTGLKELKELWKLRNK